MATTSWPTRSALASPRRAGVRSRASARRTARSESGSRPTTVKRRSRPSTNDASPPPPLSTTWADVSRYPSGAMTTALPPPTAIRPPRTRRVTRRFATLGARARATAGTTCEQAASASASGGRSPSAWRGASAAPFADSTKRTLDMKRMYQAIAMGFPPCPGGAPRRRGRGRSRQMRAYRPLRRLRLANRRSAPRQPRPLDPPHDDADPLRVAVALAQRVRRAPPVVLDSPQLDAPVRRDEPVRGAVVAVERDADAARVEQLDPVADGRPLELPGRVAEHEPAVGAAVAPLGLVVAGLRHERPHVGDRRAVPGHRVGADPRVLGQGGELVGHGIAEVLARRLDRRRHRLLGGEALDEPALGVPADPRRRLELAQSRDGPRRPRPERRHVAAEQPALDAAAGRVVEDRLERR